MKQVIERDYHGYTLLEAMHDFEYLLFSNEAKRYRFIVGYGKIREALLDHLLMLDHLTWSYDGPNQGCIVVNMEVGS